MLSSKLLERGDEVIGVDNHNDYYDPKIEEARLQELKRINRLTIILFQGFYLTVFLSNTKIFSSSCGKIEVKIIS